MIPSELGRADTIQPQLDKAVRKIIADLVKEGRRGEVDEIIIQMKVWAYDDRALGPDLARFMLEVDRMRCALPFSVTNIMKRLQR